MNPSKIVIIAIFTWSQNCVWGKTFQDVTFGSSFKLVNSAHEVRLHSQEIKYGSGSGQQSVTALNAYDDVDSHWLVKGIGAIGHRRGQAIRCGAKIRLEHSTSSRNLHSHKFAAPISNHHQEVSAYGEKGEGDTGDIWQVVCTQKGAKTWKRGEAVQLKHVDTKAFLGLSGRTFGRPISGQYEVVGLPNAGESSCHWTTAEGVFFHPSEPVPGHSHTDFDTHSEL